LNIQALKTELPNWSRITLSVITVICSPSFLRLCWFVKNTIILIYFFHNYNRYRNRFSNVFFLIVNRFYRLNLVYSAAWWWRMGKFLNWILNLFEVKTEKEKWRVWTGCKLVKRALWKILMHRGPTAPHPSLPFPNFFMGKKNVCCKNHNNKWQPLSAHCYTTEFLNRSIVNKYILFMHVWVLCRVHDFKLRLKVVWYTALWPLDPDEK
jgi:hypothetical protein